MFYIVSLYTYWLLVCMSRSLMQGLDLLDSGAFDLSDWDQRLPPPAAKTAVQTLTVVVIAPEQAGDICSSSIQCVSHSDLKFIHKTLTTKTI